jgi:hypothetical protein
VCTADPVDALEAEFRPVTENGLNTSVRRINNGERCCAWCPLAFAAKGTMSNILQVEYLPARDTFVAEGGNQQ